jgi:hypothetical protein
MNKNTIKISFYDEISSIKCPKSFEDFKKMISKSYDLELSDIEELVIYFINENDRVSISNEMDFKQAISIRNNELEKNKKFNFVIYLEVSEQSKLFKRELEQTKLVEIKEEKEMELTLDKDAIVKREQETLRREIEEKERILKDLLEKEREEIERKERERFEKEKILREKLEHERLENERIKLEKFEEERLEKEKILREKLELERFENERIQLEKLEQERLEKEQILRENSERLEKEKSLMIEYITKAVEENINMNIEKIKDQLIKQTIEDSTKALLNKEDVKKETVHKGVTCDGCNVGPIVGNRYKCTVCFNFDLCQNCEDKGDHLHPLIKYKVEAGNFGWGGRGHHGKGHGCGRGFGFFRDFSGKDLNEKKDKCQFIKGKRIDKMRKLYGLELFTDEQIGAALEKVNGKVEEAINQLIK